MLAATCAIQREVDVYVAVGQGRTLASTLGFDYIDRTRIDIVIMELARNLLVHAGGGRVTIGTLDQDGRHGILVATDDDGPGIPDIELALRDGYSTTHTLGVGLPSAKRLMDELTIQSTIGVGTQVRAIKWLPVKRGFCP